MIFLLFSSRFSLYTAVNSLHNSIPFNFCCKWLIQITTVYSVLLLIKNTLSYISVSPDWYSSNNIYSYFKFVFKFLFNWRFLTSTLKNNCFAVMQILLTYLFIKHHLQPLLVFAGATSYIQIHYCRLCSQLQVSNCLNVTLTLFQRSYICQQIRYLRVGIAGNQSFGHKRSAC